LLQRLGRRHHTSRSWHEEDTNTPPHRSSARSDSWWAATLERMSAVRSGDGEVDVDDPDEL